MSAENPLGLSSLHACIHGTRIIRKWPIEEGPGGPHEKRVPFKCNSLRHAGECRKAKAAENYTRIKKTLAPIPIEHVSFSVLTLDQRAFKREDETPTQARYRAFRELNQRWSKLRKRLHRRFGEVRFISTVEQHRSGWPHINVIVVSEALGALCLTDGWLSSSRESNFDREILSMVTECGFGRMMSLEAARSKEALGQYIAKLASEVETPAYRDETGRLVAEVSKISQAPVHAPRHFRALRASKGFLAPVEKNPDWTGIMVDEDGIRAARGYQERRDEFNAAKRSLEAAQRYVDLVSKPRMVQAHATEADLRRAFDAVEAARRRLVKAETNMARVQAAIQSDIDEAIALAAARREARATLRSDSP